MKKETRFAFDLSDTSGGVIGAETKNALRAFIAPLGVSIDKVRYDSLPNWMKKYWIAIRD